MTNTILNPKRNRPLTDDEYALLRSWLAFNLEIEFAESLDHWSTWSPSDVSTEEALARSGAWRITSPCWFSFRLKQ